MIFFFQALLYSERESSTANKKRVATVVGTVIAFQVFILFYHAVIDII